MLLPNKQAQQVGLVTYVVCINVMLSPFSKMRPASKARRNATAHVNSRRHNQHDLHAPMGFRVFRFMDTSSASSRTRFMYSSNPCGERCYFSTCLPEGLVCCSPWPGVEGGVWLTHDYSSFNSQVCLLIQPYLNLLSALKEAKYQVLRSHRGAQLLQMVTLPSNSAQRSALTIGCVIILFTVGGGAMAAPLSLPLRCTLRRSQLK